MLLDFLQDWPHGARPIKSCTPSLLVVYIRFQLDESFHTRSENLLLIGCGMQGMCQVIIAIFVGLESMAKSAAQVTELLIDVTRSSLYVWETPTHFFFLCLWPHQRTKVMILFMQSSLYLGLLLGSLMNSSVSLYSEKSTQQKRPPHPGHLVSDIITSNLSSFSLMHFSRYSLCLALW